MQFTLHSQNDSYRKLMQLWMLFLNSRGPLTLGSETDESKEVHAVPPNGHKWHMHVHLCISIKANTSFSCASLLVTCFQCILLTVVHTFESAFTVNGLSSTLKFDWYLLVILPQVSYRPKHKDLALFCVSQLFQQGMESAERWQTARIQESLMENLDGYFLFECIFKDNQIYQFSQLELQ